MQDGRKILAKGGFFIEVQLKINEVYEPFLEADTPRQIFYGGSSSGKSVFLAQRTILDVLTKKRNYLVVRNVQKSIRQSTFNELCKVIFGLDLEKYFTINKTDMVITAKTGYQILFCGLDDVQKVKSITPIKGVLTDVWIEEATEIDYNSYKELTKRLRGESEAGKRITLSFNPIMQDHWIYQEFFYGWEEDKTFFRDDNVSILKTTYKDNRYLTEDDIYTLENEKDEYYYNVYTLGNWGVLGAVIFKNWRVEDCSEIKKIADNYKNGLDFGFATDPAALIRTHYDRKHKTIYILDELYKRGLTNDKLAKEVFKMIKYEYVKCDSSEPKSIQELKNLGVSALGAKKGKDSIIHGIQWLQQQEIVIDKKCQNFKNEISQYKWKEIQGQTVPIPVDKNNHLLDALRYAYEDEAKNKIDPITIRGV